MRRYMSTLLMLCLAMAALAQSRISGRVKAKEGKMHSTVMVRAYAAGTSSIVAYTKTDAEGGYVLIVAKDKGKELDIKFSAMGYSTATRRVVNQTARLDVELDVSSTTLREVSVRAPVVRANGDTMTYSVANLKAKGDRNIEDVIKKIPGVEVGSQGQIKYNGKPINRFYIEGLDMLGGKYSLATRNIRPDDVASVSVYDRHQPIKALSGIELSEQAALNLKLKKNSLGRIIGTATAGLGWGKDMKWNAELFLMNIRKRQQTMISAKGNNFAKNYDDENTSFYDAGGFEIYDPTTPATSLFPEHPFGVPAVAGNRFFDNTSVLGSANTLVKLGEDATLTVNAGYTYTDNDYAMSSQTVYSQPDGGTMTVNEDNSSSINRHEGKLDLQWENNKSKSYLLNILKLRGKWNDGNYYVGGRGVRQLNSARNLSATDNMRYVVRKGKRSFTLLSRFSVANTPSSSISAEWEDADSTIRQRAEGWHFYTNHYSSYGWSFGDNLSGGKLDLAVSVTADYNTLQLSPLDGAALTGTADGGVGGKENALRSHAPNKADGYMVRTAVGPHYTYYFKRSSVKFSLPVRMYDLRYRDRSGGVSQSRHKPYLAPAIELTSYIIPRTAVTLRGAYESMPGGLTQFLTYPVMSTYRQQSQLGSGNVNLTKGLNLQGNLSYVDGIEGRSANFGGGYSRTESDNLINSNVGADGEVTTEFEAAKTVNYSWQANFSISKNIYSKDILLKLFGNTRASRSPMKRQGLEREVKSMIYALSAAAEKRFFNSRLSIALISSWQRSQVSFSAEGTTAINSKSHTDNISAQLRISAFPLNNVEIFATAEVRDSRYSDKAYSSSTQWYSDAGLRWNFKSVEIGLDARNLFNARTYMNRSFNFYDMTTTIYHLRPVEALLYASFKL